MQTTFLRHIRIQEVIQVIDRITLRVLCFQNLIQILSIHEYVLFR